MSIFLSQTFHSEDIDSYMDYRYVHLVWFLKSQLWGTHLLALYELAEMEYFSKNLHLCSTEESHVVCDEDE